MKRGIALNLTVILILVFLILLPLVIFTITGQIGSANQCDFNSGSTAGLCGSLYSLAFLAGIIGSVTSPLLIVVLAVYLLGVLLFFLINRAIRHKKGKPASEVAKGMLVSSAAVVGLGAAAALVTLVINWYQVSLISACNGLPDQPVQSNFRNGVLAVSVKLPEPQGRLEQYRIWSISPEGEMRAELSAVPGSVDPAWSPDGQQLAFVARPENESTWNLMLTGPDGQPARTLLKSDLETRAPAWSPDGGHLLIQQWLGTNHDLFSLALETGAQNRLSSSTAFDGDPAFSPDGSQVLFVSHRDGSSDIYRMNRDGSDVRRLTRNPAIEIDPAWSPDGKWIVFSSNRGSPARQNNYNLYIMQPDGTNQCQLTDGEGSEWRPVWSPDGQWVAYISLLDSQLYRIRPGGGDPVNIPLPQAVYDLLSIDWAPAQ